MSRRTGKTGSSGWVAAVCLAAVWVAPATVDAASVSSEVDPSRVQVGGTIRYNVQAHSETRQRVRVVDKPEFGDAFRLVGTTRSPRVVIRNGNAQRTLNLSYRLVALEAGTHELQPPVIEIGDATHRPSPQTVNVTDEPDDRDGRNRGRDDRDLFVDYRLEPDTRPYFGEQITLRYSLYRSRRAARIGTRPPEAPSLDAFWIEDLSRDHEGETETVRVDGRLMKRTTLRVYALFPLQEGAVTVEPLRMEVHRGGLFGRGRSKTLQSDPVDLQVQPLPDGAPDGFYEGNVGDWAFDVEPSSTTSRVGESVTLTLRVSGRGNPDRLELPALDHLDDFRVLDRSAEVDTDVQGLDVAGTKTVEVDLMPTTEGTVQIPPLEFVYFDPDDESYQTARSRTIRLEVASGSLPKKEADSESGTDSNEAGDDASDDRSLLDELSPPIAEPNSSPRLLRSPTRQPWFWIGAGIPAAGLVLLLAGPALARRWTAWRKSDTPKTGVERARSSLDDADPEDPDAAARSIERAFKVYLSDTWNIPNEELGGTALDDALAERDVPKSERRDLRRLLEWCEQTRYAPGDSTGGASVESALESAREVLDRLEQSATSSADASAMSAGLVFFVLLPLALPGSAAAQTVDADAFSSALETYESKDWERATEAWSDLVDRHPRRVDLLTNLGLAAARAGDLGRARHALERARRIAPSASRVRTNLEVVRKLVALERRNDRSRPPAPADVGLGAWRLATAYSDGWNAVGVVVALWLLFLGLLGRRMADSRRLVSASTVAAAVGALLVVVSASAWTASTVVRNGTDPVVVTDRKPALRTGPSEHASNHPSAGPPLAGTVLERLQRREEWTEVRLPGDRTAWLPSSSVRPVSPVQN